MSEATSRFQQKPERLSDGKSARDFQPGDSSPRSNSTPRPDLPAERLRQLSEQPNRAPRWLNTEDLNRYRRQTARPLFSLLFVIPLIVVYEVATLSAEGIELRSGMDQWLHYFLASLGIGQLLLLPLLTTAILLVQHHYSEDSWRIDWPVLGSMALESLFWGSCLWVFANLCSLLNHQGPTWETSLFYLQPISRWDNLLVMVGSGIYEELIFRLILLSMVLAVTRRYRIPCGDWLAMGLVSWIFAALHFNFLNPAGTEFQMIRFVFLFLASLFFSSIYLQRGFGIAVGTHVLFDILTL
jgi:hypothetical protein